MKRRYKAHKPVRLGDLVAAIAQPIASTIDRLTGSNLTNCKGCAHRKETLNKISSQITSNQ
jgi:hypothetical protein